MWEKPPPLPSVTAEIMPTLLLQESTFSVKLLRATPTVFPEVLRIVHSKPWDSVGQVNFRTFVG